MASPGPSTNLMKHYQRLNTQWKMRDIQTLPYNGDAQDITKEAESTESTQENMHEDDEQDMEDTDETTTG